LEAKIQGVKIYNKRNTIIVKVENRNRVRITPAFGVNDFIAQKKLGPFSLIFAGNLENNRPIA